MSDLCSCASRFHQPPSVGSRMRWVNTTPEAAFEAAPGSFEARGKHVIAPEKAAKMVAIFPERVGLPCLFPKWHESS